MSFPFDYHRSARHDIDAAYHWYEAQETGRGDEFLGELVARVNDVCAAPESFGRVRGEVRAAPFPKSSFILYYRVGSGRVLILAVLHERADPRRWLGRR